VWSAQRIPTAVNLSIRRPLCRAEEGCFLGRLHGGNNDRRLLVPEDASFPDNLLPSSAIRWDDGQKVVGIIATGHLKRFSLKKGSDDDDETPSSDRKNRQ
jgi:hypothetical protein